MSRGQVKSGEGKMPYLGNSTEEGFLGSLVVKNLPVNAGHTGLIPDLGRSHMLWSN